MRFFTFKKKRSLRKNRGKRRTMRKKVAIRKMTGGG